MYDGYQLLTVGNTQLKPACLYQYALVPQSADLPQLVKNIRIIRRPVERVVVMETVQLGYMAAVGKLDQIVGAGSVEHINKLTVVERIHEKFNSCPAPRLTTEATG